MRAKGTPKTGGRQAGTPNKVTRDVKELAQTYVEESIEGLAGIARDKENPPAARVAAYRELLDRACGKPMQGVALTGELELGRSAQELTDDELAAIAAGALSGAAD